MGFLSGLWELRVEEFFKDRISPLVAIGYAKSKRLQKEFLKSSLMVGHLNGILVLGAEICTSKSSNAPRLTEEDVAVKN